MIRSALPVFLVALLCTPICPAAKVTPEQRIEIMRGMTAEYATMKVPLPRSKKPLAVQTDGAWDQKYWTEQGKENGPAARVGDLVQVTKVEIENEKLIFEINGGFNGGRKWYERMEVGVGNNTSPIGRGDSNAPGGTAVVLLLGTAPMPTSAEIKKMLAPVMDFERRSSTENYIDSLPEPIKAAIRDKRAIEGMDREQVIMALGKPISKIRETKDGVDLEDWVYGRPPGKISFVTFNGNKVVGIKDTYAGLGGSTAPPLTPR